MLNLLTFFALLHTDVAKSYIKSLPGNVYKFYYIEAVAVKFLWCVSP